MELIAVAFGIASVVLTIRQSVWCWPTGLVQVVLFIGIFYEAKLYSDVVLHIIYVGLQFYGWYYWLYGDKTQPQLPVKSLPSFYLLSWFVLVAIGTAIWGYGMAKYTDASFPYFDAFIMVASLVAQWLMARKLLESWGFWIAVDIVAIYVYWQKELHMTSILYAIFLALAIWGSIAWRKSIRNAAQVTP